MNNENKLNPQGYVTILPVRDKLYTREEVISLLHDCSDNLCDEADKIVDTFIKENL